MLISSVIVFGLSGKINVREHNMLFYNKHLYLKQTQMLNEFRSEY